MPARTQREPRKRHPRKRGQRAAGEFAGDRAAMVTRLLSTARALGDKQMERRILETMIDGPRDGTDRPSGTTQEHRGLAPSPRDPAG